jgi:hypothetical protein
MKTRQGFVSNSSSTSFGVSHDPKQGLRVTIDLSNYVDRSFQTEAELNAYFMEKEGYDSIQEFLDDMSESPWALRNYESSLKAIREGKTVSILSVDRDSYGLLSDITRGVMHICWTED